MSPKHRNAPGPERLWSAGFVPPDNSAMRLLVEQSRPGTRLDTYLREQMPELSRGAIQRLIQEHHILVNQRAVKPTYAPRQGDLIEIHLPEPAASTLEAEDIPLEVLFEDESLLVVNKPPGIVVHPSPGHDRGTLVHALLHHCQGNLSGIGGVARPGVVHRLDKDTSGCLLIARDDSAHQHLAKQFASRSIRKFYHAILCGVLKPAQGEITAAVGRHPVHRQKMAVRPSHGRGALTTYVVQERFAGATLVEARIHTGRTHQVRVHFRYINFPVLGDQVYGPRENKRFAQATKLSVPRQMLHASRLEFVHPRSGKSISLTAPWPPDFAQVVETLRSAPL